jgi:hypothetical protein
MPKNYSTPTRVIQPLWFLFVRDSKVYIIYSQVYVIWLIIGYDIKPNSREKPKLLISRREDSTLCTWASNWKLHVMRQSVHSG